MTWLLKARSALPQIDQKGSYAMTGDLSGTPALLSGWF